MFNRPPVLDMRNPEMRDAEFQSSFVARVFGLKAAFPALSEEFKGIVPPGEVAQIGRESWGHRTEKADPDSNSTGAGHVRAWRYLALTDKGLRVVEEARLASVHGEESFRQRTVIGEPNLVTALRVATTYTPNQLRDMVADIAARIKEG